MTKNASINAERRDPSLNPKRLRASGKVPATLYGSDIEAVSIQINTKSFINIYKHDKTAIFELKLENDTYNAIAKNVQQNPVTGEILNIEFNRIKSDEKVKITVPIEIVGSSPAVQAGGVIFNPVTEIEIECLPKDIPNTIKVDISNLNNYEDALTVGDLGLHNGISSISPDDITIIKINAPKGVISSEAAPGESEEVSELTKS